MKNVEKFIKKNKEVVAIVLLLVLVWMIVKKAGYIPNKTDGWRFLQGVDRDWSTGNDINDKFNYCIGSTDKTKCYANGKNNSKESQYLFDYDNYGFKLKSNSNGGSGKWCRLNGGKMECDKSNKDDGQKFKIRKVDKTNLTDGNYWLDPADGWYFPTENISNRSGLEHVGGDNNYTMSVYGDTNKYCRTANTNNGLAKYNANEIHCNTNLKKQDGKILDNYIFKI